jgi:hypothetical protein
VNTGLAPGPYRVGIDLGHESTADHVVLVQPQQRPGTKALLDATVVLDGTRRFAVHFTQAHAFDEDGLRVPLDGQPFHTVEVELHRFDSPFGPTGLGEVSIPGEHITELVQPPTAMLDRLGSRLATSRVAFVLSRLRADPAEPVRADPELALQRRLALPAPVTLSLSGTVHLHANADSALIDRLVRSTGTKVSTSDHLPGDLGARGSAALDGRESTAWTTPFVGLVGQWWEADLGRPAKVSALDLDVVVDAHHSTPTQIEVSIDGRRQLVELPRLAAGPVGTTRRVHVPLGHPDSGRLVRLTIEGAARRSTPDWYTDAPIALPIAIAEVRLPQAKRVAPGAKVDTGCRSDLLTLDGQAVPVRITGTSSDALARHSLAIAACTRAPLSLAAGPHDLVATSGIDTGLDLDRLLLVTPSWSPTARSVTTPSGSPASPAVALTASGRGHASGTLTTDGHPFWLVLDQSASAGWHLSAGGPAGQGATLDGPHPIDGNAVGWIVRPARAGALSVRAEWTPQRSVDRALALSGFGALGCLALVGLGWWRRRRGPALEPAPFGPPRLAAGGKVEWARSVPGAVATALVAGLCIHPIAAIPTGLAMGLFTSRPRWGRFIPPTLITGAALSVLVVEARDHPRPGFGWPSQFGLAHLLTLMAVLLLGMEAIAEASRHRKARLRREARLADLERRRAASGRPRRAGPRFRAPE